MCRMFVQKSTVVLIPYLEWFSRMVLHKGGMVNFLTCCACTKEEKGREFERKKEISCVCRIPVGCLILD